MVAFCTLLGAQGIWIGGTDGENVYLKSTGNVSYTLQGEHLEDLSVSQGTVYSLVLTRKIEGPTNWGGYSVFKNDKTYNTYNYCKLATGIITSIAMDVVGGKVAVSGVIAKEFNDRGYEARMFGDLNNNQQFLTDWKRKSLKREYFRGFAERNGSRLELPDTPDEDGTYNMSLPFAVKAVRYYDGHIFATGWGEREYTISWGHTYYLVRRAPRAWMDGVEKVQQYENRTGAAYSLTMTKNSSGEYIYHTSGHMRGDACAWVNTTDKFSSSLDPVTAEAIIQPNTDFEKSIMVIDKKLYICKFNQKSATILPGVPSQLEYYDVKECSNNVYALGKDRSSGELVVIKITKDLDASELYRTRLQAKGDYKIGVGY